MTEFPPKTFTNSVGARVTVSDNGMHPMFKIENTGPYGDYGVLLSKDLPAFLERTLKGSRFNRDIKSFVLDGKPSIKVGEGTGGGIVYKPTTEDQAKRNLNFALANLAAFNEWEMSGREVQAKREANLKAAEERATKERQEREEREAKEAAEREAKRTETNRIRAKGLRMYNAANSRSTFAAWPTFMGDGIKDQWIALAKSSEAIKPKPLPPVTPSFDFIRMQDELNRAFRTSAIDRPARSWL